MAAGRLANAALSELALALRVGRPVVDLRTWSLDGIDGAVRRAAGADHAVRLSLELAAAP